MTERSVTHSTFVLERTYNAVPAQVFKAFADPAVKARWFGVSEDERKTGRYELDFRVGGRETWRGGEKGGPEYRNDTMYRDIVPDQRIIFAYDMFQDDKRISVSLATVELKPDGKGTRLTFTEQGAFLDGYDDPKIRQSGWGTLLDALGKELKGR
jgi:uncharacterized protein YndB with AHSA1/START domain